MRDYKGVDKFILANYEYLTCADMGEELELDAVTVSTRCKALGVRAIGYKEQTKRYLESHCQYKTIPELSKIMGYTETGLKRLYKEFGLIPLVKDDVYVEINKEARITHVPGSAPSILSEYKYGAEHDLTREYYARKLKKLIASGLKVPIPDL